LTSRLKGLRTEPSPSHRFAGRWPVRASWPCVQYGERIDYQSQSASRLSDSRALRSGHRAERERSEIDPSRQGEHQRCLRANRKWRSFSLYRRYPAIRESEPRNSDRKARAQIVVASAGDRQALWPNAGEGPRASGPQALLEEWKSN